MDAMTIPWLYQFPIWVSVLVFFGFLMLCFEGSYRLGLRKPKTITETKRGNIVLNTMLALLGLLIAFTYSFTVSRSDLRKQAIITQVNAISTAYHRAGLLDEPYRGDLRVALADYAESLLIEQQEVSTIERVRTKLAQINEYENKLWPIIEKMAVSYDVRPLEVFVAQSINEVLDAKTVRVAFGLDNLPGGVLIILLFVAGASLSVAGYDAGLTRSLSRWRMMALTLVLAGVLHLITDFDRPFQGIVRGNQLALEILVIELREQSSLMSTE
ncbi:hypothetical protein OO006_07530 [Prosthecochloris sp. SCSIO W1101]|uniref:bestrophin-like domain n=1 Tax=Prosthecochloris sp. SCSIO W1101 TaxID=2992242 RepID=UPI00223C9465|nr:hypothetical protein [Prosthecochloris sp. SCSIO W1101]UZJ40227.1 hypothetical protein OO006_07530 [Prosthecochloris sp. SCSIO W1101]